MYIISIQLLVNWELWYQFGKLWLWLISMAATAWSWSPSNTIYCEVRYVGLCVFLLPHLIFGQQVHQNGKESYQANLYGYSRHPGPGDAMDVAADNQQGNLCAYSLSLLSHAIRHCPPPSTRILSLSSLYIWLKIEVEDWAGMMVALYMDHNRNIALKAIF